MNLLEAEIEEEVIKEEIQRKDPEIMICEEINHEKEEREALQPIAEEEIVTITGANEDKEVAAVRVMIRIGEKEIKSSLSSRLGSYIEAKL